MATLIGASVEKRPRLSIRPKGVATPTAKRIAKAKKLKMIVHGIGSDHADLQAQSKNHRRRRSLAFPVLIWFG